MDDPVVKSAERTSEVLKGLEYTLKKRAFTTLAIRAFLFPKSRSFLDIEAVKTNGWEGPKERESSR
jgi:hypothetical protein